MLLDIDKILSHVFLFQGLPHRDLEAIASFSRVVSLKKGERLFNEGQSAEAFFIVVLGKVKVFHLSSNGDEYILHVQKNNDVLAEAAIFDQGVYPAYAESLEESKCIRIPAKEFKDYLLSRPEVSFKMMAAYSRRLRMFAKDLELLGLKDIKGRLAYYLLNNAEENEDNVMSVVVRVPKKTLAATLGTIPATLSRTFLFFRNKQIIQIKKDVIVIKNLIALKKFL